MKKQNWRLQSNLLGETIQDYPGINRETKLILRLKIQIIKDRQKNHIIEGSIYKINIETTEYLRHSLDEYHKECYL